MIGIYKITNKINGKVYIGQSTKIERRWKNHKKDAFWKNGPDYEYPLYRAIRKYGLENFSFVVLEECQICDLNQREIYYIALYQSNKRENGYNQDDGGTCAIHGKLTWDIVEQIKARIRNSDRLLKEIAIEFNVHENTIQNINSGRTWRVDCEHYPIRKISLQDRFVNITHRYQKPKKYQSKAQKSELKIRVSKEKRMWNCKMCGTNISPRSQYCRECAHALQQRAERPSPLQLAKIVKEIGFEATGRKFNVSGNTIKDWCKSYHIPYKLKDLVSWYNEQMGIVPELPKTKRKMSEIVKPVNQIDKCTGEILNTFKSASEAVKYVGRGRYDHILEVCKGIRKSAYGYCWQFA